MPYRPLSIGAIGHGRRKRSYELQACIAKGGMGEVFVALMREPGRAPRQVVIKRLLRELREDFDHQRMFQSEGEVLAHLDHPNIVAIFDAPIIDGTPCLAIEFVNGRSVSQILDRTDQRGDTVPVQACIFVMVRVLRGLAHAHSAKQDDGTPLNLVHRDITPGNLMLSFDGEVKITDFGISKSQISVVSTTVGIVKGKARYLAPEQILGEPASPRSDLFSTACVVVEMLHGRPLFERATVPKTLYAIVHGQRPPVGDMIGVREPLLVDALETALSTDPKKRQQNASELAEALQRASQAISVPMDERDVSDYLHQLFEGQEEHWEADGFDQLEVDTASGEGSPDGLTAARAAAMRDGDSGIVEVIEVNDSELPIDGGLTPLDRQNTVRVPSEPSAPVPTPYLVAHEDEETLAVDRDSSPLGRPHKSDGSLVAVEVSERAAIAGHEETLSDAAVELTPRPSAVALRIPGEEPITRIDDSARTEPPARRQEVVTEVKRPRPRANKARPRPPERPKTKAEDSKRLAPPPRRPLVNAGPALFVAFAFGTLTGVAATLLLQSEPAAVPPLPPAPVAAEIVPAEVAPEPAPEPPPEEIVDDEEMPALPPLTVRPVMGALTITGPKGARVRVNGKLIPKRLPVRDYEMAPGEYEIQLRKGRWSRKYTIEIEPGEDTKIQAKRKRRRRR